MTPEQERLCLHWRPTALQWLESYTYRRVPASVKADIISDGLVGLMEACETYDPANGASFPTYAYKRVIGAAIDGLRDRDWVPRSVRQMQRRITAATEKAEERGPASEASIAAQLKITADELAEWRQLIYKGLVRDLDHPIAEDRTVHEIVADPAPQPDARLLQAEQISELHHAIRALPERERYVIQESFFNQRTLRSVGDDLGVTEGRVSQLRKKALQRMRPFMREAA